MTDTTAAHGPGMKLYVTVWILLLVIAGIETRLAYTHLATEGGLLPALLILAALEAGIALLYFMHLKFERKLLLWCVVGYLGIVCFFLNHIWRDAARMISLHP
jgi:heme/copper-type cytochrome/quinol oxidase subunit 4